jgi:hypothetical protein
MYVTIVDAEKNVRDIKNTVRRYNLPADDG